MGKELSTLYGILIPPPTFISIKVTTKSDIYHFQKKDFVPTGLKPRRFLDSVFTLSYSHCATRALFASISVLFYMDQYTGMVPDRYSRTIAHGCLLTLYSAFIEEQTLRHILDIFQRFSMRSRDHQKTNSGITEILPRQSECYGKCYHTNPHTGSLTQMGALKSNLCVA